MAKTRAQKEQAVTDLAEKLSQMKTIVISSLSGVGVNDTVELRKKVKQDQVELVVVKKRLLKLALEKASISGVPLAGFSGTLGIAIGFDDEVMPAKAMEDFRQAHKETVELYGGVMDNKFITTEQVSALAALPSYPDMLAKTVWTIKAPMSGIVNVLSGSMRNLVFALSAIKESK